jgi:hypothetical protein
MSLTREDGKIFVQRSHTQKTKETKEKKEETKEKENVHIR